jgi:hypothetical protein
MMNRAADRKFRDALRAVAKKLDTQAVCLREAEFLHQVTNPLVTCREVEDASDRILLEPPWETYG